MSRAPSSNPAMRAGAFSATCAAFVEHGMATTPRWKLHRTSACAAVTPLRSATSRTCALRKGGTQVQVGLFGGPMELDVGSFATAHKHLMGNFVGSLDEFTELMEYVRSGEKKDIPLETCPIETVNEAIEDLRAGTIVGRCVLTHAPREPSL